MLAKRRSNAVAAGIDMYLSRCGIVNQTSDASNEKPQLLRADSPTQVAARTMGWPVPHAHDEAVARGIDAYLQDRPPVVRTADDLNVSTPTKE